MLNYFLVGFPRGFTCQTLPVDFGLFLLKRLKAAGHHIASKLRVPEKKHNKHVSMRNFSRFGLYQKSQTKTNKLHTSYSQVSLDLWVFHLFTPCWFRGFLGEDLHASGWLPFFSSKPTAFPICHGQRSHRERPAVHKKKHTPNLDLIQCSTSNKSRIRFFWFKGNLINTLILQTCGSFHGLMLFKGKNILLRHAMGVTACTSRVWFSHDEVLDLKNFSNPCSKPPFFLLWFSLRKGHSMRWNTMNLKWWSLDDMESLLGFLFHPLPHPICTRTPNCAPQFDLGAVDVSTSPRRRLERGLLMVWRW